MLLNYCMLAISVSIDSLGIGITYGLRHTKIVWKAKLILFCISFLITTLSVCLGTILLKSLPSPITTLLGSMLLCMMGIWVIYQAFHNQTGHCLPNINNSSKTQQTSRAKSISLFYSLPWNYH